MADPVVHITSGVPDSGTGNITTLGQTLTDGANITIGATTDAAVTAGATGSVSAKLRSISRDVATAAQASWRAGAGVGLTWTTIMSTDLNSLASTNALLQAADIDNTTALDKYMDLSLVLASAIFPNTNGLNVSVHIYPLSDDGSHYGDGKFTTAAAGPPAYPACAVFPLIINVTQAQYGQATGILIPPGKFRVVLCNNAGVNFAGTNNTLKYRTYS
jgi:hypothetical protein